MRIPELPLAPDPLPAGSLAVLSVPSATSPTGYESRSFEIESLVAGITESFAELRLGTTVIPLAQLLVVTPYHTYQGLGSAPYVRNDTLVTSIYDAAHPYTTFRAPDENGDVHGYILAQTRPDILQLGGWYEAVPSSAPIQALNRLIVKEMNEYWGGGTISGQCWISIGTAPVPLRLTATPNTTYWQGVGLYRCGFNMNSNDSVTWPLFSIPEGYARGTDDAVCNYAGTVYPSTPPVVNGGAQSVFRDLSINTYYGKWAYCFYTVNTNLDIFENVRFSSANRGYFASQGFNAELSSIVLDGLFYVSGRTQTQVEEGFPNAFGIFSTGHIDINQVSATGYGAAVSLSGLGLSLKTMRAEICECSGYLGNSDKSWDNWNGTTYTGSTSLPFNGNVTAVSTESSRWGLIVNNGQAGRVTACAVTGTAGAVNPAYSGGPARAPMCGYFVGDGVLPGFSFANCVASVSGAVQGGFVNFGSPQIDSSFGDATQGTFALVSKSSRFVLKDFRPGPLTNTTTDATAFSNMMLRGLTSYSFEGTPVFCKKIGGSATITAGNTFVDVVFSTGASTGGAAFNAVPAAVVDAGSTLPAGTYYYSTTLGGANGMTGVDLAQSMPIVPPTYVAGLAFRRVTVAAGERVDMTFFSSAAFTRYIFRGTKIGYWDAVFTQVGTDTTFSDSGQSPLARKDVPPLQGASLPSLVEDDTSYKVMVSGFSDFTTHKVSNIATTGFRVSIPSALGADLTFNWMIFR